MFLPNFNAPGSILGAFFFVLTVLLVPWLPNGADLPRWVLLAAIASIFAGNARVQPAHARLGLSFLICAALSLLWTPDPYRGALMLLQLAVLAGLFCAGSALPSLRPVLIGAGFGMAVNSVLVVAQNLGWQGIPQATAPAGLFVNKNYVAEAAMLVLIGLMALRLRWLALAVAPAAILPLGRGALLAGLAAGVAWVWTRSRAAAAGIMAVGLGGVLWLRWQDTGMAERWGLWRDTVRGLTPLGHGLGSFQTTFPVYSRDWNFMHDRPAHAHSDWLEFAFELGPGALLLAALCAMALRRGPAPERLMLVAFLTEAAVGFPTHWPVTAALAALVLGRLCACDPAPVAGLAGSGDRYGGYAAVERALFGADAKA